MKFQIDFQFGLVIFFGRASFIELFNMDLEHNVPAIFSAILLGMNALLLGVIRSVSRRWKRLSLSWFRLMLLFVLLSIDELVSLHEELIVPARDALKVGGAFYFASIIPGMALITVTGSYVGAFGRTSTVEETLELSGIAVLLHRCLSYARCRLGSLQMLISLS